MSSVSTTFGLLLLLLVVSPDLQAQRGAPKPSPSPTPQEQEQEPVRVFTEEVRLPVIAVDQFGHYDPTLVTDDVLVLEDGIAQQIRSVRHIPANVLLVLDTGGEVSGLGEVSKSTSLTKAVAVQVLKLLPQGSSVEVMQFNNSVDVLQRWTSDKQLVLKALKTKVLSGKRARFADAMVAAAQELKDRPEGSRHVVLITDGVDTGGKADRSDAIKQLIAARATVHVISYTEFVRQKKTSNVSGGQRPASSDPITATDPTLPPGTTRSPSFGVSIRFDPAMRRKRKAYEDETRKSEQVLTGIAEETGGKIFLPISSDQMMGEAKDIAADIGAEYVVTYRPKRPLSSAKVGEYRKIEVASRRVGLTLHSRRGYVVPSQNQE
ncbi:MAG TPA: VWA domain-containing protein [Pyrinomonadaceae bacterium]|nr:VWA domain-containing protein [Pyrinomonadaceae bacterium]